MEFNEYQRKANQTAVYPGAGSMNGIIYCALGLCGESGEVAEKVKKVWRDYDGKITDEIRQKIAAELGDVCWYLSQLAVSLGVSFDEIAVGNLEKLASRQERNVLHGSGDNR